MTSLLGGADEANTDYVLLILDRGWGLANRVRTMVWAMMLAISHRLALVVLWRRNRSCDIDFEEVFPTFDEKQRSLLHDMDDPDSPGWLIDQFV